MDSFTFTKRIVYLRKICKYSIKITIVLILVLRKNQKITIFLGIHENYFFFREFPKNNCKFAKSVCEFRNFYHEF